MFHFAVQPRVGERETERNENNEFSLGKTEKNWCESRDSNFWKMFATKFLVKCQTQLDGNIYEMDIVCLCYNFRTLDEHTHTTTWTVNTKEEAHGKCFTYEMQLKLTKPQPNVYKPNQTNGRSTNQRKKNSVRKKIEKKGRKNNLLIPEFCKCAHVSRTP